jgi:hypothetical protein
MSVKGEKYASKGAKMKHEKMEGKKERMMEYGSKAAKKPSAAKPTKVGSPSKAARPMPSAKSGGKITKMPISKAKKK